MMDCLRTAARLPRTSSFLVVLDFESANVSPIVPGLNATAKPKTELALRKPRRDFSFDCFIVGSIGAVGCMVQKATQAPNILNVLSDRRLDTDAR